MLLTYYRRATLMSAESHDGADTRLSRYDAYHYYAAESVLLIAEDILR